MTNQLYEDALYEIRRRSLEIDQACTDLESAQALANEITTLSYVEVPKNENPLLEKIAELEKQVKDLQAFKANIEAVNSAELTLWFFYGVFEEMKAFPVMPTTAMIEGWMKRIESAANMETLADDSTQKLPLIETCSNCKTLTEVESFHGLSETAHLCEDCRVELEQD